MRAGDARGWLLPVAVAAELTWAVFLWRDYGGFPPWVRTAAVVAGATAFVIRACRTVPARDDGSSAGTLYVCGSSS